MKSFVRRLAGLGAAAMMVLAVIGFSAGQANARDAEPTDEFGVQGCSHSWSILDGRYGSTTTNGVNIRTGPHNTNPACTIVGQAQASHTLQFDCWVSGTGGSWSHVYDLNTGVQGWIKDSLLTGYGAHVHC